MAIASTIAAVFLSLAQLTGGVTNGRVISVEADSVQISVLVGEEPAIGDTFEVYIDLPEMAGTAIVGSGTVTSVREGVAVARIEKSPGRINKNAKVRLISAKAKTVPDKTIPPEVPLVGPLPSLPPGVTPVKPAPPVGGPPADVRPIPPVEVPPPAPSEVRPADPADFGEALRRLQSAVVIVGDPSRRVHGTGFVISKAQRLIVTNAHVADIAKIAVLNESRTGYKVKQIWYHPGVLRTMDDGKTLIQSANPADGDVLAECADVAILKLEPAGTDLPAEVRLASPEKAQSILGMSVGIFGYPGYQTDQVIGNDLFASATFVKGGISRMSGLGHAPDASMEWRHSVQYDARTYGGFSGSPVFLVNGEVVAVHNHSHHDQGERNLGGGLRIDVLWELLQKENMTGFVSGSPAGLPQRTTFQLPEHPRLAKFQAASRLIAKSADLITHDEFTEAQQLLDEAIEELPDYWKPYHQKSKVVNHVATDNWNKMTADEKVALAKESLAHLQKASQLHRQTVGNLNASIVLDQARDLITLGRVGNDRDAFKEAVNVLDEESIRRGMSAIQLGHLLALRGAAKTDLDDLTGALRDLDSAIKVSPQAKDYYNNRAWVLDKLNRPAEAARDRATFRRLLGEEHHHHHHD